MKGKQGATARDGGGEELGQLTRVFLSCQSMAEQTTGITGGG